MIFKIVAYRFPSVIVEVDNDRRYDRILPHHSSTFESDLMEYIKEKLRGASITEE
jgi:hypothetical protein